MSAEQVALRVVDAGTGMPDEVVARAFDPFFTTKSAGQGTGMGLGISRRLVEMMGGSITIDTELGHGTTVSVLLRVSEQPVETEVEPEPQAAPVPTERRPRVLLVEDERMVRRSLARALES